MKKYYEEHNLSYNEVEEMEDTSNLYVVFEEDFEGKKTYDLTKAIFDDKEVAIDYAKNINCNEDLYVAKYDEYFEGNYDYVFELKK